jgi:hypothetical protein
VEYSILFSLDTKYGEFVCEAFHDEILQMKKQYSAAYKKTSLETDEVQERRAWEYVARAFLRRYRFDTIFAANRFGSIFQYIQGGNVQDKKGEPRNGEP